jgi:hypothetical protein
MTKKLGAIILYALPIVAMIGLIPVVLNDYVLTGIYIAFIIALLIIKRERNDIAALLFGLIGITVSEYFFVSTGVEVFTRNSLLGVMPLWLPFLWAYAFVSIKRSLRILDR